MSSLGSTVSPWGGSGSNVASLVLNQNWDCLLIDGKFENPQINLHRHYLTSENIADIFSRYSVPKEPEYVSIDVDSTDLWLFRAVARSYRAMVFSVEYNSNFPLDTAVTFPNDPEMVWHGDKGYGASLRALNMVAQSEGYSLVRAVTSFDLFFVRDDLIEDAAEEICFPIEKWRDETSRPNHRPVKIISRLADFVDYKMFTDTDGDISKSRRAGARAAKKYLGLTPYDLLVSFLGIFGINRRNLKSALPPKLRSHANRLARRLLVP